MTDPIAPHSESAASGTVDGPDPQYDWEALENSPEFKELVTRRRRFVVPATVFFLGWYFGFIILAGYAEDFMGGSIYEGLTVGYVLALTQFVMVWALGWWYLRKAAREFDPLEERARAVAERALHGEAPARDDGRRAEGDAGPAKPVKGGTR